MNSTKSKYDFIGNVKIKDDINLIEVTNLIISEHFLDRMFGDYLNSKISFIIAKSITL